MYEKLTNNALKIQIIFLYKIVTTFKDFNEVLIINLNCNTNYHSQNNINE